MATERAEIRMEAAGHQKRPGDQDVGDGAGDHRTGADCQQTPPAEVRSPSDPSQLHRSYQ
jgi:hypothetical protein